ncbi:hypothetical protein SEA_VULPECULA_8 [Arthrobacter phage Vulpecula]|nr:hypothetical protein SEA_VULPECULA_8 [Arthrobacter phage Vulpecula]
MALSKYNVTVNNHKTVLQLSDKDAKARGLTEKDLFKPGKAPARASAPAGGSAAEKAAAAPANKAAAAPADK